MLAEEGGGSSHRLPEKPLTTSAVRLRIPPPFDGGATATGLESVYPGGSALSLLDDARMISGLPSAPGGTGYLRSAPLGGPRGDSGRSRSHESLYGWDDGGFGGGGLAGGSSAAPGYGEGDLIEAGSRVGSYGCSPLYDTGDPWFGDLLTMRQPQQEKGGILGLLAITDGPLDDEDWGQGRKEEDDEVLGGTAAGGHGGVTSKKKKRKQKKTKDIQQRPPPWLGVSYEFVLPRLTVTWIHQNEVVSTQTFLLSIHICVYNIYRYV